MAVWQFDFYLVPRKKMLELFGHLPSAIDWDKFNSIEWWENVKLPQGYEKMLDSFLPQSVHWSATTKMWGEENGNRIEISKDAGHVSYIFTRINVGEWNYRFLDGIVHFANHIETVFVTAESKHIAEPSVDFLVTEVENSNAFKFVKDPEAFLKVSERMK